MAWQQVYNPLGSILLSAIVAAIPVAFMLVALAFLHMRAAPIRVVTSSWDRVACRTWNSPFR